MLLQPIFLYQKPVLKNLTSLPWLSLLVYVLTLLFITPATLSAQCTLSCNGSLNASLNANGEALITPQMLLTDPDCDPSDFTVNVTYNGNSLGNLITCDYIGYPLIANAIQTATGNSCYTNLYVIDFASPQIVCLDTLVSCISPTTPDVTGYPTATDNCTTFTTADLNYSDVFIDLPCFTMLGADTITAKIERKWWVTDDSGLADTCIQIIYMRQNGFYDIVFPPNHNGLDAPILNCNQDPNDLNITGRPTIEGFDIPPNGTCDLSITYVDSDIDICLPGGYNKLRTWTAFDDCSGDWLNYGQLIKVMDTTAPLITCPSDFTVGTSVITCQGTVNLPSATVVDDCSGYIVDVSWNFGSGLGPFYNVPLGTHTVTYTATDDCGNSDTCTMQVTVEDNVAPVNICKSFISVNISSGGTAAVPASTFDDGSFDNCGVDYFEVKRDSDPYGTFVVFDCADIAASPVGITLRVFDAVGNYNDCVAQVSVHDNIYPIINCPPTAYIECEQDYLDTLLTGTPIVVDNCGVGSLSYSDSVSIDPVCQTGTVERTWTLSDLSNNTVSCTQLIIIEDNTPVTVSFPGNYTTSLCGANVSPAVAGEPQITNDNCESVSVSHNDIVFNPTSSCKTILRDWIVVDWCTYVPNSGSTAGYYTYSQVITISDNDAPVITCPASFSAGSLNPACGGTYVVIDSVFAADCSSDITITNNSAYASGSGADASGVYPLGVHVITYTADDNCGNVATCSLTVTVEDALSPNAICFSGLAVSLNANGMATINVAMMNNGSSDNCTSASNLVMSVSPSTFTCADVGLQYVDLLVTDADGNSSLCTGTVDVQDNLGTCNSTTYEIGGQILTHLGAPMKNVDMQIINTDTAHIYTDASGDYLFDMAFENNNYLVKPVRDTNAVNGVSTYDLILISKHVLGTDFLDTPYEMIAADANRSGTLTTFDMVLIKKIILFIDSSYTNNTSWRFVDANYVFPNSNNPFQYTFPEAAFIETISANANSVDFLGVKIGDVSGNASANGLIGGGDDRSAEDDLIFEFENKSFERGEELIIPFEAETPEDLQGYQYTIEFDKEKLEFVGLVEGDSDLGQEVTIDDFGFNYLDKGFITTSWLNLKEEQLTSRTKFFQLKFKAKERSELKEALTIGSEYTSAEAYNGTTSLEKWNVIASFNDKLIAASNILHQNYPNPFSSFTSFSFELEESTDLSIIIHDEQGRMVKQMDGFYTKGKHTLRLDRSDIIKNGTYFYSLIISGKQTLTRKMMVVDR